MNTTRSALGHATRAQAAADELRRRIIEGELAEGFPLRQDALAAEFGISRIPLREAFVQLESEGLIQILPHKGAIVSELSIAEIEELFELRALLEPMLLSKSAPRLTESDFIELDRILAEYSEELHANSPARWGELNTRLHQRLMSRADQPKATSIVNSLLLQTDRYTRLQLSLSRQSAAQAETEHAELVNLCRNGQAQEATALLKRHIGHVSDELREFLLSRRKA